MPYRIGILGATGAVGREMVKILEERKVAPAELRLLAGKSAGETVEFCGEDIEVKRADAGAFAGLDIVLGAAEADVARDLAPYISASGAVFVDNSSAFRLDDNVPLVVPEINPSDIYDHHGVIASPNCTTTITLTAVNALRAASPIVEMNVSSYQAVSGAGSRGISTLIGQAHGEDCGSGPFAHRIAYNVIPFIGSLTDNGYTDEEMKMQNEGQRILHLPGLRVSCTCVRVPVLRSHGVAVQVITRDEIAPETGARLISEAPGCRLVDDPANGVYPMPLDTTDQDLVYVGRIRKGITGGLMLWCCADQLRKGAATNTVQIAELLMTI